MEAVTTADMFGFCLLRPDKRASHGGTAVPVGDQPVVCRYVFHLSGYMIPPMTVSICPWLPAGAAGVGGLGVCTLHSAAAVKYDEEPEFL